jgi:hypothetical protein
MPEDADERKRWNIRTWAKRVRVQGFQDVDKFGECKRLSNGETRIFNQRDVRQSSISKLDKDQESRVGGVKRSGEGGFTLEVCILEHRADKRCSNLKEFQAEFDSHLSTAETVHQWSRP